MSPTDTPLRPGYPPAERQPVVETIAGQRIADPYRWLEADGERTGDWLAGQQRLWQAARHPSRPALRRLMDRLTAFDVDSVPVWRGPRRFFLRREADREHEVLMVATGDGPASALVDVAALDPTGRSTLDRWEPSRSGDLLAYQISVAGSEHAQLHVLAVDTGVDVLPPRFAGRYAPVAWLPGDQQLVMGRSAEDEHHVVAVALADGAETPVPLPWPAGRIGDLELAASSHGRVAVTVADTGEGAGMVWICEPGDDWRWRPVLGGDGWTDVWFAPGGALYLLTSVDAPQGRLDCYDPDTGVRTTVVPEDPGEELTGFTVLADGTTVTLTCPGGASRLTGPGGADVPLPGHGVVTGLGAAPDGSLWFSYSDPLTAPGTFVAAPGKPSPSGRVDLPVALRRYTVPAADGTPIPVQVLEPEGATGPLPTVLHGYGAFGTVPGTEYHAPALAWAGHGGRFVIAGVRGGGEGGGPWHAAGIGSRKPVGIKDFLTVAEHLHEAGLAGPDQLAALGESAGGLLIGAAITQRPDLFAAAACVAPILDLARSELFGLGAHWTGEFGRRDDPEELAVMLGYSPYHQVRPGVRYPAVLLAASGNDTRVPPLHARKMCAALQHATASGRPVLLRHEDGVGHGWRARTLRLDLHADILSFLATHTAAGSTA